MALRPIQLSPKHVLLSACLLLVLASGVVAQIAAQQTTWAITLGFSETGFLVLLVNGMPYCIPLTSGLASSVQQNQPLGQPIPLDGLNVYEGTCDPPLGPLVGPITGTLTIDSSGPGPFSIVLVYTVGFPGLMSYHSEWKLTGDLQVDNPSSPTSCTFENVVSDASVRGTGLGGIGLNVDLQLLRLDPESGACSVEDGIVLLPTFVYSVSNVSPVGGVVMPADTFALVAPWLAIVGLVGCIGTVVVVAKKRRQ
jgi:hypothetical protein